MKLMVTTPADPSGSSRQGQTIKVNIGNLPIGETPTFGDISLAPFNLAGQENVDFTVAFAARNGFWHQLMYLRRSGGFKNGGRWLKAIRVLKIEYGEPYKQAKSVVILEKVDDGFPMEGVVWKDWLLYDH